MMEVALATTAMDSGHGMVKSADHNSSTGNWTEDPRQSLKIMTLIVNCLTCVLGVLGNGVVIWVMGFKMKKTVISVWFLNLAVADFLSTASLPVLITMDAMGGLWPFGKFMCKLFYAVLYVNMFGSIYFLVVISVDRCVSVVHPIWSRTHRSVRRAVGISLAVWLFALVLSSPHFVFRDTTQYENNTYCIYNFIFSDDEDEEEELRNLRRRAIFNSRFLLGFLVPFIIIISCYAVIIHRLRNNIYKWKTCTRSGRTGRSFKIIAAVIATFFLCWAPYHILRMAYTTNFGDVQDPIITIGLPIAISLVFLNSCLNPFLYVFVGQDFKDMVRKSIPKMLENAVTE